MDSKIRWLSCAEEKKKVCITDLWSGDESGMEMSAGMDRVKTGAAFNFCTDTLTEGNDASER